jgi:hypothetical protein
MEVSGQGYALAVLKSATIFKYYDTQNLRDISCVNENKCCRVPRKELVRDIKYIHIVVLKLGNRYLLMRELIDNISE